MKLSKMWILFHTDLARRNAMNCRSNEVKAYSLRICFMNQINSLTDRLGKY